MSSPWPSNAWREQPVAVSGVLITYNHERYIRGALESVLAQTNPLDLVVSDDCSTDQTVSTIEKVLEGYRGPHSITLRLGRTNIGICRNQNAALRLARGEIIVLFEGDDISAPGRVARIVETYLALDRKVAALGSGIRKMDQQGTPGEQVVWPTLRGDAGTLARGEWLVHGCGLAIRRDCFSEFGPISWHLISGDVALWMRAAFAREGGVAQVPEVLVHYRIHGGNASREFSVDYSSKEALRACCRKLLENEVAQVGELRRIRRYRRSAMLTDEMGEHSWNRMFRVARLRAGLVLAVSRQPRWRWIYPALKCTPYRTLRRMAVRTLITAFVPWAVHLYRAVRASGGTRTALGWQDRRE